MKYTLAFHAEGKKFLTKSIPPPHHALIFALIHNFLLLYAFFPNQVSPRAIPAAVVTIQFQHPPIAVRATSPTSQEE